MKTVQNGGRAGKENAGVGNEFPRVAKVLALLGKSAVLLPWPLGQKATGRRWAHRTLADMVRAAYLRDLETGNIGVALGTKSEGLCSIDWDDDLWMEPFLALNPALRETLRTRGARGCNFWLRCIGTFPGPCKLKADGKEVGEWRATGNQTIISGQHPSGCEYTFVVEKPPVAIDFPAIVWPEGVSVPRLREVLIVHSNSCHPGTQCTQLPQETQETYAVCVSAFLFDVAEFVPTARKQSDGFLWLMARQVRGWERDNGRKADRREQDTLFDAWWPLAQPHVDPAMDYFTFHAKWIAACRIAVCPRDETPLVSAWRAALKEPLPPEASLTYGSVPMGREMQLLVALCYQLQKLRGEKPFFLGSRDAAALLGHSNHTTVFCWLESLSDPHGKLGVLKKERIGSQAARLVNEWLYLPLVPAKR